MDDNANAAMNKSEKVIFFMSLRLEGDLFGKQRHKSGAFGFSLCGKSTHRGIQTLKGKLVRYLSISSTEIWGPFSRAVTSNSVWKTRLN